MSHDKNKFSFSFVSILLFGFMALIIVPTQAAEIASDAEYVKDIAKAIIPWFNLACILATAISLVQLLISRDQKVINGAYKYMGIVIATFFIFNLLGSIFAFADNAIITTTYDYSVAIKSIIK